MAVLMTQATGTAIVHETVFENKLGYARQILKKWVHEQRFLTPMSEIRKNIQF